MQRYAALQGPLPALLFILWGWMAAAVPVLGQATAASGGTDEFWQCVEQLYGTSDYLVNGRPYGEAHPGAAGHPFFGADAWRTGHLYAGGRTFEAVSLKYNTDLNRIVLRQTLANGLTVDVLLNDRLLDSFRLDGRLFVPVPDSVAGLSRPGYLEQLYAGNFAVYRAHEKAFVASYAPRTPHGRYSVPREGFWIRHGDTWTAIGGANRLSRAFPEHRQALRRYLRQHGIDLQKATPEQLRDFLQYADKL